MTLTIIKNPRVKTIMETALKSAKPYWCTPLVTGFEPWSRKQVWFICIEPELYENGNAVSWCFIGNEISPIQKTLIVDGFLLAKTATGEPFWAGPINKMKPLSHGDGIIFSVSSITWRGELPEIDDGLPSAS